MKPKHLITAVLATAMLSACSDDRHPYDVSSGETQESAGQKVMLVDAMGNPLCSLPSVNGTYYLQVTSKAAWKLRSNDPFIVLLDTVGYGPKTVTVLVGENWNHERTGTVSLSEFNCTQEQYRDKDYYSNVVAGRLTAARQETASILQQEVSDLDRVRRCLSSNRGAGYSYNYAREFAVGTGLEVFNMLMLEGIQESNNYHLIEDDYYPQMRQKVTVADSKEELEQVIGVEASLGINLKKVQITGTAEVGLGTAKDSVYQHSNMSILGSYFTREINYMNCVALARGSESLYKDIYSPGFRMIADDLAQKLSKLTEKELADSKVVDPICQKFIDETGVGFISKCLMGCQMDYQFALNRSALCDTMNIHGMLSLKVSFAAGSISAEADVKYKNKLEQIDRYSESSCTVRGGNVQLVSTLSSGGAVPDSVFHKWQLSVTPETAVMIDMKVIPIYSVLVDPLSHDVMEAFFDRKLNQ